MHCRAMSTGPQLVPRSQDHSYRYADRKLQIGLRQAGFLTPRPADRHGTWNHARLPSSQGLSVDGT
jgi:hypothetical protein